MKKSNLLLIILSFFTSFVFAQNSEFNPPAMPKVQSGSGISMDKLQLLDQHIETFVNQGHVPGGVFVIARKGKIVYNKSFGYQTLAKKKKYQKDDIFRLASMTKAFTTVSIMQLYEQGKLGLDDPIFYYIPAFKQSAVLDQFNEADSSFTTKPVRRPITIRHLLTHTSGITYGVFNPGKIQAVYEKMGANNFGLSADVTTEQMANQLAKVPLIFQPGEKYMYGLNMEILGRVVEVVSGKRLNQYFKENIMMPLGIEDTGFYLPKSKHDRLVPVYTYDEKGKVIMAADTEFGKILQFPKRSDNNHYAGGGGMSGTAMDYMIFIQTLLNEGEYGGKRILSRKTIEVMTSDQLILLNKNGTGYSKTPGITYGLGFALKTDEGTAHDHKSAGTYEWGGYFNTKFFIDPEEELVFVGMTQIVPFQRNDFWDKMYAIIYGAIE
ncbi:MAG: serine hydrolase domain-containing protein [Saprospiraceae bacterium]